MLDGLDQFAHFIAHIREARIVAHDKAFTKTLQVRFVFIFELARGLVFGIVVAAQFRVAFRVSVCSACGLAFVRVDFAEVDPLAIGRPVIADDETAMGQARNDTAYGLITIDVRVITAIVPDIARRVFAFIGKALITELFASVTVPDRDTIALVCAIETLV